MKKILVTFTLLAALLAAAPANAWYRGGWGYGYGGWRGGYYGGGWGYGLGGFALGLGLGAMAARPYYGYGYGGYYPYYGGGYYGYGYPYYYGW